MLGARAGVQTRLACTCGVEVMQWLVVQARQYGEAFELTSNQRVDLNVIVDYAWPDFLRHADDFVKEVQVNLLSCPSTPLSSNLPSCLMCTLSHPGMLSMCVHGAG